MRTATYHSLQTGGLSIMNIFSLLVLTSINSATGGKLQCIIILIIVIVAKSCRIGGALSFTSGPSLPGRRSTGTDMQHYIRDRSPVGVHCSPWEYELHNRACIINWTKWHTNATDNQQLHDHFFKALWSKCPATNIQDNNQSCEQRSEWNRGELLWTGHKLSSHHHHPYHKFSTIW